MASKQRSISASRARSQSKSKHPTRSNSLTEAALEGLDQDWRSSRCWQKPTSVQSLLDLQRKIQRGQACDSGSSVCAPSERSMEGRHLRTMAESAKLQARRRTSTNAQGDPRVLSRLSPIGASPAKRDSVPHNLHARAPRQSARLHEEIPDNYLHTTPPLHSPPPSQQHAPHQATAHAPGHAPVPPLSPAPFVTHGFPPTGPAAASASAYTSPMLLHRKLTFYINENAFLKQLISDLCDALNGSSAWSGMTPPLQEVARQYLTQLDASVLGRTYDADITAISHELSLLRETRKHILAEAMAGRSMLQSTPRRDKPFVTPADDGIRVIPSSPDIQPLHLVPTDLSLALPHPAPRPHEEPSPPQKRAPTQTSTNSSPAAPSPPKPPLSVQPLASSATAPTPVTASIFKPPPIVLPARRQSATSEVPRKTGGYAATTPRRPNSAREHRDATLLQKPAAERATTPKGSASPRTATPSTTRLSPPRSAPKSSIPLANPMLANPSPCLGQLGFTTGSPTSAFYPPASVFSAMPSYPGLY